MIDQLKVLPRARASSPAHRRSRRVLALAGSTAALTLVTATTLLAPNSARATWLPGWGIDGTPGVQASWCNATSDKLYLGDFDGNGHTDLLCHSVSTGRRRIDFAFAGQRGFWGSNWDSDYDPSADKTWCSDAGALVFVGDYNGDDRDDLLCFMPRYKTDAGRRRIDFAEPGGWLRGTDFDSKEYPTATQAWCVNEGETILVGDFNGDGKDDLLCRVPYSFNNAGRKRIDYANSAGTFFGTNFDSLSHPQVDQGWCSSPGMTVYVGDYNGDGKDDLLCHTQYAYVTAGQRRIDFAGAAELPFEGDDFYSANAQGAAPSWCATLGDNLRIGDVNGDGKDDLLCANGIENGAYRGIRVDHANSAGAFYGTNGQAHHESWCTNNATSRFYTGDFDGDGADDVLCHDRSSGYRGIRYANSGGDFHSLCSDDSVKGDGELPPLPVHFAVVADPAHPDVSIRGTYMPSGTSTHTHPMYGSPIDQSVDSSLFFKAEIEVMNYYARGYDPDTNQLSTDVCVGQDCIIYDYESHVLYPDLQNTACQEVLNWANYPDPKYAANCESILGDKALCHPNPCGNAYVDQDNAYNYGFGCAIRQCTDPRIRKPQSLNVVVMDRCDWDQGAGGITNAMCSVHHKAQSFGFGGTDRFFTGWDYGRMLRGTHPSSLARSTAGGLEQHELGHVLSLGHTADCAQNRNAMDKSSGCGDDGEIWRDGGYSTKIGNSNIDQFDVAVTAARNTVKAWSCN